MTRSSQSAFSVKDSHFPHIIWIFAVGVYPTYLTLLLLWPPAFLQMEPRLLNAVMPPLLVAATTASDGDGDGAAASAEDGKEEAEATWPMPWGARALWVRSSSGDEDLEFIDRLAVSFLRITRYVSLSVHATAIERKEASR